MEEKLLKIRHSLAHVLAGAVLEHDPEAKFGTGPATDTGFYYDIELSKPISEEDFPKLEEVMRETLKKGFTPELSEISYEDAKQRFENQPYKLELVEKINDDGGKITIYKIGNFIDLCEGPHVENSSAIDPEAFTLSNVAGAYWQADESNQMLTRVYGIAFETKKDLDEYLARQEELKERDHRKIGKELGLWTFSDLVGTGLPLFTPKGTALRNALYEALVDISQQYGFEPVTIPHLAKHKLYEISGHAEKFEDELLYVKSHYDEFVLKPVNCPHHTQIYAGEPRSYRDLPLRYMESTMQYRDEKPGEIGGLTRVRAITVDDGHIFCRIDQVDEESKGIANIVKEFYSALGMWGNHWVSLSVRDPKAPEKYIGDDSDWEKSERLLQKVSDDMNLDAKRMEGEAALYGPKLDFMFVDALGRERQLATIQIDFAMPKRFGLTYTDKDGSKKTPVMVHRAVLGSYERFLAIVIEHFSGNFPLWLAPVQVGIIPVAEGHHEYAEDIKQKLLQHGLRAQINSTDNSLGKRIHAFKSQKVPYMIVVGDKEVESQSVTPEHRDAGKLDTVSLEDFIENIKSERDERRLAP